MIKSKLIMANYKDIRALYSLSRSYLLGLAKAGTIRSLKTGPGLRDSRLYNLADIETHLKKLSRNNDTFTD